MRFIYPIYPKEMWEFSDAPIVGTYLNTAHPENPHWKLKKSWYENYVLFLNFTTF